MEDEFIEDDFLDEEEDSGGSNNRPFLVAVGALVTVFILAAVCTLAFLMAGNRSAGNAAEIAAIETKNAETLAFNATVTRQIAQTETAQAMPTDTPEPPATNTSTPLPATETPETTNTPVLDSIVGEDGEDDSVAEGPDREDAEAGADGDDVSEDGATGTIDLGDGNGSDGATVDDSDAGSAVIGDAEEGALPQTGLETWGIAIVGLLLVVVLFAANRLRTN